MFRRYKFDKTESRRDFESKLDSAISGLESDIAEKRKSVQNLLDELNVIQQRGNANKEVKA